jgi:hypothetical protein
MKGIAMTIILSVIIWAFWMSWQHLRKPKPRSRKRKQ